MQTYLITAINYTPGTGIQVAVHRHGCRCNSVDEAIYRSPFTGSSEAVHRIARKTAQAFGLAADDYCWMDCALSSLAAR